MPETYERHNQSHAYCNDAETEQDKEESPAESFSASETHKCHETDEEDDDGANHDDSVEGSVAADGIKANDNDGDQQRDT